jgi:hypothetical protein
MAVRDSTHPRMAVEQRMRKNFLMAINLPFLEMRKWEVRVLYST